MLADRTYVLHKVKTLQNGKSVGGTVYPSNALVADCWVHSARRTNLRVGAEASVSLLAEGIHVMPQR